MAAIDYALKRKCVELAVGGMTHRDIYKNVFLPAHDGMSFETFSRKLRQWKKKHYADDVLLDSANLDYKFEPYAATVQVNRNGGITQAWIKQTASDGQYERLIEAIKANTEPVAICCEASGPSSHMLEIPFYDMHLGIADAAYYHNTVTEVIDIINRRRWAKIIIPIGQDLFHNDDFHGRTTSGRVIEKVDIPGAWDDARSIYCTIIDQAYRQSDDVEIIYIPGNHDESMSWAFVQLLKERYGNVDDRFEWRKVRTYGRCFIGFTHGQMKKSKPKDLRGSFIVEFAVEFAATNVREIHAGHLHHEKAADEYGVMVRRLCTGAATDDWSDSENYIGAHKRFMVFDWSEDKLSGIHYV